MKYRWVIAASVFMLSEVTAVRAQQAADYFPAAPSAWTYNEAVLDSLQQKIGSLSASVKTVFIGDRMMEGRTAHCLVSDPNILFSLPVAETTYVAMSGSVASVFLESWPAAVGGGVLGVSTLGGIARSFRGWYDMYRFAATVGASTTIFSKDTTVTINTASLPLRFWVTVARLSDQTANVPAGSFTSAKRFVVTFKLSLVIIPQFPVDIAALPDTTWIGGGRWIVRETTPTQTANFALIGGGSYSIPGTSRELAAFGPSTGVKSTTAGALLPAAISISAWPNPFNPDVTIEVRLTDSAPSTIAIVDLLGRVVEYLNASVAGAGIHRFHWNAADRAGGMYYVRVTQHGRTAVTAVQLLK